MPIYEYECKVCGHKLEKLQKISDEPLKDCPACEEPGLRKLVSAVAFRLKGGGWYETDFKDEKSRRNVAKEDEKAAESGAGDSAGAEQKKKDNGKTSEGTGAARETKVATKADSGSTTAPTPAD